VVKLTKIYTRTGDDGTTGLVDGSRASKDNPRMRVIGDVDELNSCLGVAALHATADTLHAIRTIQNDYLTWGLILRRRGMILPRLKWCCGLFRPKCGALRMRLTR
jgi:cob(I)alamin adenosyltransferase